MKRLVLLADPAKLLAAAVLRAASALQPLAELARVVACDPCRVQRLLPGDRAPEAGLPFRVLFDGLVEVHVRLPKQDVAAACCRALPRDNLAEVSAARGRCLREFRPRCMNAISRAHQRRVPMLCAHKAHAPLANLAGCDACR